MKPELTKIDEDLELDMSRADRFVTPAEFCFDRFGRKLDENGQPIGELYDGTRGQELYDLPRVPQKSSE